MAKNPFPSFNWYGSDWLGSRAHAVMTLEQQGAYRNLLDHAWESDPPCSLPDDDSELALLSGARERWLEIGPKIREWFIVKAGRLYNPRLSQTYRNALIFSEAKSRAGKLGNEKRWKDHVKSDRSAILCDSQNDRKRSLPTPTPTPKEETTKKNPSDSPLLGNPKTDLLAYRAEKAIAKHQELDKELRETLEKTSHLRALLGEKVVPWWEKVCAIYEPQAEFYLFDEIAKADLWCEGHGDRKPHSLRGAQQFMSNWFKKAEEGARVTAAKMAQTRRIYATEAPKRFQYQPGR